MALFANTGVNVVSRVGDTTAPTAAYFVPADNATGVSVSANLMVSFGEFVRLGLQGNITLKLTSNNNVIEAWDVALERGNGPGKVSVLGETQLTMRLTSAISAATEHYVIWDAGVVEDGSGNPVAVQSSTTAWSFTTA